jgi:hypothetical protein
MTSKAIQGLARDSGEALMNLKQSTIHFAPEGFRQRYLIQLRTMYRNLEEAFTRALSLTLP